MFRAKLYTANNFNRIFIMIALLPSVFLLAFFVFLFVRETKLDRKRFLEADRLADEHVLREVERFLKEQPLKKQTKL
jgi:hypothetical protein